MLGCFTAPCFLSFNDSCRRPKPPRNSMEQNLSQAIASAVRNDGLATFQVFYNAADLSTAGRRSVSVFSLDVSPTMTGGEATKKCAGYVRLQTVVVVLLWLCW